MHNEEQHIWPITAIGPVLVLRTDRRGYFERPRSRPIAISRIRDRRALAFRTALTYRAMRFSGPRAMSVPGAPVCSLIIVRAVQLEISRELQRCGT